MLYTLLFSNQIHIKKSVGSRKNKTRKLQLQSKLCIIKAFFLQKNCILFFHSYEEFHSTYFFYLQLIECDSYEFFLFVSVSFFFQRKTAKETQKRLFFSFLFLYMKASGFSYLKSSRHLPAYVYYSGNVHTPKRFLLLLILSF